MITESVGHLSIDRQYEKLVRRGNRRRLWSRIGYGVLLILCGLALGAGIFAAGVLASLRDARAHDASHPHAHWYNNQTINEAARQRLNVPYKSCCDAGDHYKTRFRVAADNSDQWQYQDKQTGAWKVIPPDIIKDEATPENQPVLFINRHTGVELCFFVPRGGI